jgi:hypothetical protein
MGQKSPSPPPHFVLKPPLFAGFFPLRVVFSPFFSLFLNSELLALNGGCRVKEFGLNKKRLFGGRYGLLSWLAAALMVLAACSGLPMFNGSASTQNTVEGGRPAQNKPSSTRPSGPLFTGNGGKGITIAVPAPSLSGGGKADAWMSQLFQDLITGDLRRYSAMTVLDRLNESLAIAEQELSASGSYSDDDYIALGRLTNAKYIVAGTIQRLRDFYSVSFRVNDTETNEIQASFNKQYGEEDILSGLAAKEAVRELLAGLGVELTSDGERQLLTIQERPVKAQANLARGMAAERADNDVEALAFFIQARDADPQMREASQHIQNFANVPIGTSIQEKARYAQQQKEKWEKIFVDLEEYVLNNLPIVIYDFSTINDTITDAGRWVNLDVTPGVKIIPNRTVLEVWKKIGEEWLRIYKSEENKSWAKNVRTTLVKAEGYDNNIDYIVRADLYDGYGIPVKFYNGPNYYLRFSIKFPREAVLPQSRYYNNTKFSTVNFNRIEVADITTDVLTPRIDRVVRPTNYSNPLEMKQQPLILSVPEWEQWLAEHEGR